MDDRVSPLKLRKELDERKGLPSRIEGIEDINDTSAAPGVVVVDDRRKKDRVSASPLGVRIELDDRKRLASCIGGIDVDIDDESNWLLMELRFLDAETVER
mmetsp:Transcript_3501/g.4651  ORF Transcript_3501/g.4651 Transcript_3501/m.4651 type:complete len:101 (-) Transcript_3501:996-1298(-)